MPFTVVGDGTTVAHRLLDATGAAAERLGHPVWVLVRDLGGGRSAVTQLADDFDAVGWVAPHQYDGMGLVATGRLRQMDQSLELAASLAAAVEGHVRMACVVLRSGLVGWHMVLPDGSSFDEIPREGRMLDVLRRCLALPTPGPPTSMAPLYDNAWLADVLESGRPERPLSWNDLLLRHPVLLGRVPTLEPPDLERLVDALTRGGCWEEMRLAVAAGSGNENFPPAGVAAWMDDGMFARWVLDSVTPIDDMLTAVRPWLRPAAARRLGHWVRSRRCISDGRSSGHP